MGVIDKRSGAWEWLAEVIKKVVVKGEEKNGDEL